MYFYKLAAHTTIFNGSKTGKPCITKQVDNHFCLTTGTERGSRFVVLATSRGFALIFWHLLLKIPTVDHLPPSRLLSQHPLPRIFTIIVSHVIKLLKLI